MKFDPHGRPHWKIESPANGESEATLILTMMQQLITRRATSSAKLEPMPLYEAIPTFASQRCSDPRDKIFGLQGISRSHIQADYHYSLAEIYLRALFEGIVEIMEHHEAAENDGRPQTSGVTVRRLKVFCYTLQHALGLSPLNPAVMLVSTGIISRLIPPDWIYYGLSYSAPSSWRSQLEPLLQGQEPTNQWFRVVWLHYFHHNLYSDVCGQVILHRHTRLRKLHAARRLHRLAELTVEIVAGFWWLLAFLRMHVLAVHQSKMAFSADAGDARTWEEWTTLERRVFEDMDRRGVIPARYTDLTRIDVLRSSADARRTYRRRCGRDSIGFQDGSLVIPGTPSSIGNSSRPIVAHRSFSFCALQQQKPSDVEGKCTSQILQSFSIMQLSSLQLHHQ